MQTNSWRCGEKWVSLGSMLFCLCLAAALPVAAAPLKGPIKAEGKSEQDPRLWQAQQLIKKGEVRKGRQLLAAILATSTEQVQAHLLMGSSYLKEDPNRAKHHAFEVLSLEPQNVGGITLLGRSFATQRQGLKDPSEQSKVWEAEIEAYKQVLRQAPDWPAPLFRSSQARMAVQQLLSGRVDQLKKAAAELKRVAALVGQGKDKGLDLATVEFRLGLVYKRHARYLLSEKKGRQAEAKFELALDHFRRSLEQEPRRLEVLAESVGLHRLLQQPQKGRGMIEKALEGAQDERQQGRLHELLAGHYRHVSDKEEAILAYTKALALNPDLQASYMALARLHFEQEQWEQTEAVLKRSIEVIPGFLRGYLGLSEYYISQEQPRRALRHLEEGLVVQPRKAVVMGRGVGVQLERQGLYAQMAISAGWLYLEETQEIEKAKMALEQARGYGQIDEAASDLEGWIHYHGGEYERALQVLRQAEVKPMNDYHLAAVHFKRGEIEKARQRIAAALKEEGEFRGRKDAEALRLRIDAAGQ
jgi:tetratricopeptide (TPR) repeat protein